MSKRKAEKNERELQMKRVSKWVNEICLGKDRGIRVEGRRQGWGTLRFGQSLVDGPLCVAGRKYKDGFGSHADSEIVLRSQIPMTRFQAVAGMDDNRNTHGVSPAKMIFSVHAAGRELWKSPLLGREESAPVDVALPGNTRELVLRIVAPDGQIRLAHADWAEAKVSAGNRVHRFHAAPDIIPFAPFSFLYDGQPSHDLLPQWNKRMARQKGSRQETIHQIRWLDPKTGLECRMQLSEFPDFPALEWVLFFRNHGVADTPVIEAIKALDLDWRAADTAVLFRSRGSLCQIDDFEYMREELPLSGKSVQMVAGGGRSSNNWLPFFHLQDGANGLITAIGWTGQWAAEFHRPQGADTVRISAGMEKTHLRLHPGEEIRTPRILMLFGDGDRMAGHNALRQFLLRYHTPRPISGKFTPPLTIAHWGGMKAPEHLKRIQAYASAGFRYDYCWVDAGWYGPADSYSPDEHKGDWAQHVGNWTVNPAAHPNGLRPIADAANEAGMKFLLWFEPERAISGTPWTMEHPEWFLGERKPLGNLLLNLGNPELRQWLTRFLLDFFKTQGVDLYRQDFNFEPLPYWRNNDAPDRQGMTEIRHIEGLYMFWDALLEGHPGLIIDNCASGGRRIDLETISRSIPLWRSDWQCFPRNDPIGGQVHGMGLSHWVPLHGTGSWGAMADGNERMDTYRVRSNLGPALQLSSFPYEYTPVRKGYAWKWHRKMIEQARRTRPLFEGDYTPLTGVSPAPDQWAAYQMHRTDLHEGFVLALRRPESPYATACFRLQGLSAKAVYEIEDADTGRKVRMDGRRLMDKGLLVETTSAPDSRLFFFRRRSAPRAFGQKVEQ